MVQARVQGLSGEIGRGGGGGGEESASNGARDRTILEFTNDGVRKLGIMGIILSCDRKVMMIFRLLSLLLSLY